MPEIDLLTGIYGLDLSVLDKEPTGKASTFSDNVVTGINFNIPDESDLVDTLTDTKPEETKTTKTEKKTVTKAAKTETTKDDKTITDTTDIIDTTDTATTDTTDTTTVTTDTTTESPFRVFANLLHSQGTISEVPKDFEETDEGINELIRKEIDKSKEEWVNNLPEDLKYIVENWKEGVPLSSLLQTEAQLQDYENIKSEDIEKDETIQKSIIRDYYTGREGWTDKDIADEIAENEESGTLASKAKRYHSKLIQEEKSNKTAIVEKGLEDRRNQIGAYKQQVDNFRKGLKDRQEIIPGMKINDNDRRTIFDGVTKFDKEGKNAYMRFREKNPDIDLISTYIALVLDNDFSKLDKAAITKATKSIKNKLDDEGVETPTLKGIDISVIKNALNTREF